MKKTVFFGMLAIVLVFGLTIIGCKDSPTDDNDNQQTSSNNNPVGGNSNPNGGNNNLPVASGVNAVSGKTYYGGWDKIDFSVTAEGALNGNYSRRRPDDVLVNGKYTWNDMETGTYTWNDEDKTITLIPEYVSLHNELLNKANYRQKTQVVWNEELSVMSEADLAAFNEELLAYGFSNINAYINYIVDGAFSFIINGYSFCIDGNALFLEEPLPPNKGTNELSGQTYLNSSGTIEYVFSTSGFTSTGASHGIETGSYAYDSINKEIWLRIEKINGKDRAAYYNDQEVIGQNYFIDDYAYRAAMTNNVFRLRITSYNNVNKIIGN